MDKKSACEKLQQGLQRNFFEYSREYPYKNVKPRIIAESLIEDSNADSLIDYKFYCFDGTAKCLAVCTDRTVKTKFDYFDMNFKHLPFKQGGENNKIQPKKPKNFEKMIALAQELSQGIPHVRIDFYNINGKIYFGEFTFFDSSGFDKFTPDEWDFTFGSWLKLPSPLRSKN